MPFDLGWPLFLIRIRARCALVGHTVSGMNAQDLDVLIIPFVPGESHVAAR
jgi:hypothetical protein